MKFRDPMLAIQSGPGTLYQGRDAEGEFWCMTPPAQAKPPTLAAIKERIKKNTRDDYYEPPAACYCSVLGRMAPCSWCTDPERTDDDFNGGASPHGSAP